MPFIPIACLISDKLTAEIVYCTEEQYRNYKELRTMPENFLQTTFLEELLSEKGLKIYDLLEKSSGLSGMGEKHMYEYVEPRFMTIEIIKEILEKAEIEYDTFIDAYCEHLKSL